jgi:coenzyme F420-0:L-glutamate ligase/coenzyme F420-1:gamma-L-glutamate ligase
MAVTNLPEIKSSDDLVGLLAGSEPTLKKGDVLVVTQKVVSKAEGRLVRLDSVRPTQQALQIANQFDKHPGLVQLVLDESQELLRVERGILISRTREGFVCANAGIDLSNVDGVKPPVFFLSIVMNQPDNSAQDYPVSWASPFRW